jgi:hypothetical protein
MKIYLLLVLILIARLLLGAPIVVTTSRPSGTATPTPSPTPGGLQTFEETGAPTGWTDVGTPSVDWDSTSSPLAGAQTLLMTDVASGGKEVRFDFSEDVDEFWIAFKFSCSAIPASGTPDIFTIKDGSANSLATVRISPTTGTVNGRVDASSGTTVISIVGGSNYRMKLRYKKGSGANEELQIWCVAEGSGTWGTAQAQTNGTSTARGGILAIYNTAANNLDLKIDNLLVKTSDIAIAEID